MASSISSITQRPNSNKWYITGTQSFEEPRNLKNESGEPRKLSGKERFEKFLGHEAGPSDHLSSLPTNENSVAKERANQGFTFSKAEPEFEDVDQKLEAKYGKERPRFQSAVIEGGKQADNQANLWGEEDHVDNEKTPLWGKTDLGEALQQGLPPQPQIPHRLQHQMSLPQQPLQHFPPHKKDFHPALKHCASTEDNGRKASYDLHAPAVGLYGSPKPTAKTFKKKVSPFYTQAQQQKSSLAAYAGNQAAPQHPAPQPAVMPSVPFPEFLAALMKAKNCGFRPFACVSKNPTTDKWFYIDEKGGVQGGFTPEEMDTWYNLSYFGMELLIAINDKSCFKPLRVYLEIAAKVAYDLYFNVKTAGSATASHTSGNSTGERVLLTQKTFSEGVPTKVPQRSFAPSDSL